MEKEILQTRVDRNLIIYIKVMDANYKAVGIDIAAAIGSKFDKDRVLIFSFDSRTNTIHSTAWGKTKEDAIHANAESIMITKMLGGDLEKREIYEDPDNLIRK